MKKQNLGIGLITLVASVGISLFPSAKAQVSNPESIGRARDLCTNQAKSQGWVVNQVISISPINQGATTAGYDVTLSVSRPGSKTNVRCIYDSATNRATILQNTSAINPTPEAAAKGLVQAWQSGNRSMAAQYATPGVVNQIFGLKRGTTLQFAGCQGNKCLFNYSGGSIRLDSSPLPGSPTPNYRVTQMIIMNR